MIGKVTWVGHITCADCPQQLTDIHWGEAKAELRRAGWQKIWRKSDYVYVCNKCAIPRQR